MTRLVVDPQSRVYSNDLCQVSMQKMNISEAEFLEFFINLLDSAVAHSLGFSSGFLGLLLVEELGFGLSLLLKIGDNILLGPSDHGAEIVEDAGVSVGFDSQNLEGLWDDHSLLVVVWERHSFENLQSLESSFTSGGFVRKHTSKVSPEHSRWGSEMFELASWVSVNSLSEEFVVCELISEKRSRENQLFTSDNNDSLSS